MAVRFLGPVLASRGGAAALESTSGRMDGAKMAEMKQPTVEDVVLSVLARYGVTGIGMIWPDQLLRVATAPRMDLERFHLPEADLARYAARVIDPLGRNATVTNEQAKVAIQAIGDAFGFDVDLSISPDRMTGHHTLTRRQTH